MGVKAGLKGSSMKQYEMRRIDRQLTFEQCIDVLEAGQYCVVATKDEDGFPYGVPLSYALIDDKLCFHTTNTYGHKLDDFALSDQVSATIVTDVHAFFDKDNFTTTYASVIVRGHLRKVTDDVTKRKILVALCMKYSPEHKADIGKAMAASFDVTETWILDPEEMTGKRREQV